jgi:putative NADH-flavin reductase
MHTTGVSRIVVLGAAGAKPGSLAQQPALARWVVQHLVYDTILKWPMAAQRFQYETLSASDLDWTMVLPPRLTNSRARGRYRIDRDALPPKASRISRADVADFMIRQLTDPAYVRQAVYLAW